MSNLFTTETPQKASQQHQNVLVCDPQIFTPQPAFCLPATQQLSVSPPANVQKQARQLQGRLPRKFDDAQFQKALQMSREAQQQREARIRQQQAQMQRFLNADAQERILRENLRHEEQIRRAQAIREQFRLKVAAKAAKASKASPKVARQLALQSNQAHQLNQAPQAPQLTQFAPKTAKIQRDIKEIKKNDRIYRGIVDGRLKKDTGGKFSYGVLKPIEEKAINSTSKGAKSQIQIQIEPPQIRHPQVAAALQRQAQANSLSEDEVLAALKPHFAPKLMRKMLFLQRYSKKQLETLIKIAKTTPKFYKTRPLHFQKFLYQQYTQIMHKLENTVEFGILTSKRPVERSDFSQFARAALTRDRFCMESTSAERALVLISAMPELLFCTFKIVSKDSGCEVEIVGDRQLAFLNNLATSLNRSKSVNLQTSVLEQFYKFEFNFKTPLQKSQFLQFLLLRNDFPAFLAGESCVAVELDGGMFEIFTADVLRLFQTQFPVQKFDLAAELALPAGLRIRSCVMGAEAARHGLIAGYLERQIVADVECVECDFYVVFDVRLAVQMPQNELKITSNELKTSNDLKTPQIAPHYLNTCYFGIPNAYRAIPEALTPHFTALAEQVYGLQSEFLVQHLQVKEAEFLLSRLPELFWAKYSCQQLAQDVKFTAQSMISASQRGALQALSAQLNASLRRAKFELVQETAIAEALASTFKRWKMSFQQVFGLVMMRGNCIFQIQNDIFHFQNCDFAVENDNSKIYNINIDIQNDDFAVENTKINAKITEICAQNIIEMAQKLQLREFGFFRKGTDAQVNSQMREVQQCLKCSFESQKFGDFHYIEIFVISGKEEEEDVVASKEDVVTVSVNEDVVADNKIVISVKKNIISSNNFLQTLPAANQLQQKHPKTAPFLIQTLLLATAQNCISQAQFNMLNEILERRPKIFNFYSQNANPAISEFEKSTPSKFAQVVLYREFEQLPREVVDKSVQKYSKSLLSETEIDEIRSVLRRSAEAPKAINWLAAARLLGAEFALASPVIAQRMVLCTFSDLVDLDEMRLFRAILERRPQ
ncbi:hypothetical protein SS50377_22718 [Spironucleus salmonicida]|uniref:Uncharacterized protein n=1 Tax=Spironucleus salmonicida TaxID=348837 RepID=V6LI05_9EUKA|nr:hypothetical protein SS50377_22718 [Spironucleus salmonicida]|eukprot:EST44195.1 Hypothetical protein SS50377_16001 [Spironucleus salmonicida]